MVIIFPADFAKADHIGTEGCFYVTILFKTERDSDIFIG